MLGTEAAVLEQIRMPHHRGETCVGIAAALKADQVPTRHGGKWYSATVYNILRRVTRSARKTSPRKSSIATPALTH